MIQTAVKNFNTSLRIIHSHWQGTCRNLLLIVERIWLLRTLWIAEISAFICPIPYDLQGARLLSCCETWLASAETDDQALWNWESSTKRKGNGDSRVTITGMQYRCDVFPLFHPVFYDRRRKNLNMPHSFDRIADFLEYYILVLTMMPYIFDSCIFSW